MTSLVGGADVNAANPTIEPMASTNHLTSGIATANLHVELFLVTVHFFRCSDNVL